MVSVAIMGHGVVGSGVAEILLTHKQKLFASLGEEIHIKKVLDLREFPDSPIAERFTKDFEEIINDREIRVVVEVMGGLNPAYDYVKRCLKAGKSVATSNKELVAAHGAELLQIAKEENVNFLFEASVGGGIPIIRPMNQCLVANNVNEVAGILNGTTNFILTKMIEDGMQFEDALKLAQDLGFAERNPAADIEGHDACRKIAILSSLMCGKTVRYEDIPCEGISHISMLDVAYARSIGRAIKLLGVSQRDWQTGTFYVRTAPYMVPASHPLHGVEDVFNAVFVHGNLVDNLMFYGRGAGKFPTASAVVSDMLDCALNIGENIPIRWSDEKMELSDPALNASRFFVRIHKKDLEKASGLFRGFKEVSLDSAPADEAAFTTGSMKESSFEDCAKQLSEVRQVIRLLED